MWRYDGILAHERTIGLGWALVKNDFNSLCFALYLWLKERKNQRNVVIPAKGVGCRPLSLTGAQKQLDRNSMKNALIIGDTGGIGSAISKELRSRGANIVGLSRSRDGLDVTDEASIVRLFAALTGPFDLVFVASGALDPSGDRPEKSIRDVSSNAMAKAFEVNAIGPMLILKHALPLMAKNERSVFAALSARVGSIGDNRLGGWHSYRASKAALNQCIHGAAIEMKRTHKGAIAVVLHPGTVATEFTAKYAARHSMVSPQEAAVNLLGVIEGLEPKQSGGFFDFSGREIIW